MIVAMIEQFWRQPMLWTVAARYMVPRTARRFDDERQYELYKWLVEGSLLFSSTLVS